jgi:hypothetical protein
MATRSILDALARRKSILASHSPPLRPALPESPPQSAFHPTTGQGCHIILVNLLILINIVVDSTRSAVMIVHTGAPPGIVQSHTVINNCAKQRLLTERAANIE